MLRHLAILTEYDGGPFSGWQEQKNAPTVQQSIRETWLKLTGEDLVFTGSSRTDAGVHARGHVASFTSGCKIPTDRIPLAFNSLLPEGIAVRDCVQTEPDFNARFSACGKLYRYHFCNSSIRPAIQRGYQAHVPGPLKFDRMSVACDQLIGRRDWRAMMDQGSVIRDTRREIIRCCLVNDSAEPDHFYLEIAGDGFLYHMVRILAGTIIAVGQEKLDPEELTSLLDQGWRPALGKTMPGHGLELFRVYYPHTLFGQDSYEDYLRLKQLA